jgi:ribosomal protein L21
MQNFIDLEDKIFFECQNILESLSKIYTKDELLLKQELCYELTERIAFLKVLEKNEENILSKSQQYVGENEENELHENEMFTENTSTNKMEEDELEEVIFNNELNEIHHEEPVVENVKFEYQQDSHNRSNSIIIEESSITSEENKEQEATEPNVEIIEKENNFVEEYQFIENEVDASANPLHFSEENELPVAELIKEDLEVQKEMENPIPVENTNRGKILEDAEKINPSEKVNYLENEPKIEDKKVQLTPIKGMKIIESLFDDDPLDRMEEKSASKENFQTGKTLKDEITADITKKNIEFRLDLNDKIAFSKYLFNGSQVDLNDTIHVLNSFKNMEEAKQYLSDLYYEKHWDKADEYAQRLWLLVENKFL